MGWGNSRISVFFVTFLNSFHVSWLWYFMTVFVFPPYRFTVERLLIQITQITWSGSMMRLIIQIFIAMLFFKLVLLLILSLTPLKYHRLSREQSFLGFKELLILLLRYSWKLKFDLYLLDCCIATSGVLYNSKRKG